MKQLLFITHQLSHTGAPVVLCDVMRFCKDRGYEITVISMLDGELRAEVEKEFGPVTIRDKFYQDKDRFLAYAEQFDGVICNTLITYEVIHVMRGSTTKVLWWLHEGEQYFEYFKTVLPDFARLSSNIKVYAVSPTVQDVIRERYATYIPLLHFGVKDTFVEEYRTEENRIRFVVAGTYSKLKGQDIACQAIALLPKEVENNCEFIFCGNETTIDDEVYRTVCELTERDSSVVKAGALSHDATLALMQSADFLLVSSRVDPMPTVAVEAAMLHCPCVITEVCGMARYFSDGKDALLCEADDAKSLAQAIERAVSLRGDKISYRKMCNNAHMLYEKTFSEGVFHENLEVILDDLVQPESKKTQYRIVFPVGVYDILDIFTYAMLPEFEHLGYEYFLFDTKDMVNSLGGLYEFVQKPVAACVTFNNLSYNTELVEGQNLWDALGIPCVNILMDHPFCHRKALDDSPQGGVVLCPDYNHVAYIRRFYPNLPCGFLAHGGKPTVGEAIPIADRSIDILYAGGISRKFAKDMMPDFSQYEFDAKEIAGDAYDRLLSDPSLTTEQAIEESLLVHGIHLEEKELCKFFDDLHYVDLLIVSHFREEVIRTLAGEGLHITLYGTGWEVCDWIEDCPTLHFEGRISADEIVEKMRNTRIVLSTMTWFKDGTHDRVFNGMLAGALAVTDSSLYMKDEFVSFDGTNENEAECLMFELTEISSLPERIRTLLSDDKTMQRIANNGRNKAVRDHTWAKRVDQIHEYLVELGRIK